MYLIELNLKYLVLLGMGAMLLLFISFLFAFISNQKKKLQYQKNMQALHLQQQNQLIEAAVRSEEIERHRIAETLHDEVGAILSSTKLHFQGIKATGMDARDKQLHERGMELLDDGIQKVRGISHNLHSSILKEFGLNEALQHFINAVTRGTLMQVSLELDPTYTTQNTENDISIYRLVQELVQNILKHSAATELRLRTVYENNQLQLFLFHNGTGLTQERFEALRYNREGLGLKNIQNRIILLHGVIHFTKEPDGYNTFIELPVNATTHD